MSGSRIDAIAVVALASLAACCAPKPAPSGGTEGEPAGGAAVQVAVAGDGRSVSSSDGDGKILWTVDVIAACGAPAVGDPVVREVSLKDGHVHVVYGKHSFATIDGAGHIQCTGSD